MYRFSLDVRMPPQKLAVARLIKAPDASWDAARCRVAFGSKLFREFLDLLLRLGCMRIALYLQLGGLREDRGLSVLLPVWHGGASTRVLRRATLQLVGSKVLSMRGWTFMAVAASNNKYRTAFAQGHADGEASTSRK